MLIGNKEHRDLLIHAGPGAGKTLGALLGFKEMKKERLLSKFLVFCHRNSILNQWRKSADILGLKLDDIDNEIDLERISQNCDGWIVTYQGAISKLEQLLVYKDQWLDNKIIAIADEAHHLGLDPDYSDGPIWGKIFNNLTQGSTIRLGLTGTPFRSDNLAFCSARKIRIQIGNEFIDQISPDLCVESSSLISAGDVRPLEFHFQDGWVEHRMLGRPDRDVSSLSKENRESWRARNLRRAIRLSDSSSIGLQLLVRAKRQLEKVCLVHENAAGLVIARDIGHAKEIANFLEEDGFNVELVHSKDRNSYQRLALFEQSNSNWLVSVDMCSEGFDAPRLRVVAYLTTIVTKSRFIQSITRAVRMTTDRAAIEPIPREPSFVFAPADPLLMQHARDWSKSKPYLIKGNEPVTSPIEFETGRARFPSLPMEAVNDGAGSVIRMQPVELPNFL